jgi:hypothetical protein
MTSAVDLSVPDFTEISDEAIETLLPQADGAWSRQTKALMKRMGADKLNLNSNWADVRRDWCCEACQRRKTEIARVSDNGVLLCQLDWHHDHLRDHAKGVFRPLIDDEDKTPEARALRRGIDACKDLTMRFFTTLLCADCNTAEGQAKIRLKGLVPAYFSFSPQEIARFIRVTPNGMHTIDDQAALEVWLEVQDDVAERVAFLDILTGRLSSGGQRIEGSPYYQLGVSLSAVLAGLASQQDQDALSLYRIKGVIAERSVRQDGFGVSPRPKRAPARTPTPEVLATFRGDERPSIGVAKSADATGAKCFACQARANGRGGCTGITSSRSRTTPTPCSGGSVPRTGGVPSGLTRSSTSARTAARSSPISGRSIPPVRRMR